MSHELESKNSPAQGVAQPNRAMAEEMLLIFEKSKSGRCCTLLPECDVPLVQPEKRRIIKPRLPEMTENDISRHYTALAKRTFGVNDGFYPLGSCTMKYNPKVHEEIASMEGFTAIHPLQPMETAQGCLEMLHMAETTLCEITGMDRMTFQPAAGAHGELTGLLLIKAYHTHRGDTKRTKVIIPDAAHGTNPASAAMAGYSVVSIPSDSEGFVDLEKLKEAVGEDTAGLMLTNPNTVGRFDKNILEITKIIHDAGGLCYYDGANLNAVLGIVRPGDMGFDVVHLNLHKTFSTPHGGGGPGSGPVGVKAALSPYLPNPMVEKENGLYKFTENSHSIGKVSGFYGNFLVALKALAYIVTLGRDGLPKVAEGAVLNANYMLRKLSMVYDMAYADRCMHEFVISMEKLKKQTGVTAMDIAKGLLDYGIHPPTMYFPLIVPEALMLEPVETEAKETIDRAIDVLIALYKEAVQNPEALKHAPQTTPVSRPDEVLAARKPVINYYYGKNE